MFAKYITRLSRVELNISFPGQISLQNYSKLAPEASQKSEKSLGKPRRPMDVDNAAYEKSVEIQKPPLYKWVVMKYLYLIPGLRIYRTFTRSILLKIFSPFEPKQYLDKYKMRKCIHIIYEAVADNMPVSEFFKEFDMEDSYMSWFLFVELHCWMLCVRFMRDDQVYAVFTRDTLLHVLWTDARFRMGRLHEGLGATVCSKSLGILQLQMHAALYGYDEGLTDNDKTLAAVVWRRFFTMREDVQAEQLEKVVAYIRVQMDHLNKLSHEDIFMQKREMFIPLAEAMKRSYALYLPPKGERDKFPRVPTEGNNKKLLYL